MSTDLDVIDRFLHNTLTTDAGVTALVDDRVFGYVVPEGEPFPAIVFQYMGGIDVRVSGAKTLAVNAVYLVKAVAQGSSFSGADAIAKALHNALQAASGVDAGGYVYSVVRESPFSLVTVEDKVRYNHRGGLYRILAKAND